MSHVHLIQVPYHFAFQERDVGVGLAAGRYLDAGLEQMLAAQGHVVSISIAQHDQPRTDLEQAVIQFNRRLAHRVQGALSQGALPLVMGGGCGVSLGVLAALPPTIGIIWLDAHGDYNTPETSPSGFFDGMPLAIATGLGHQPLREMINRHPPIPTGNVLLAGVQQLDPGEIANLEEMGVAMVPFEPWETTMRRKFVAGLDRLAAKTGEVYLHFDLDVLNLSEAPSVDYREPSGLALPEAIEALRLVGERLRIRAAAVTAYNPEFAGREQTEASGLAILQTIAQVARR